MKNINVIIMAGGSGTRFWPYSRETKPKQFLDVLNINRSLLQMTYDRFIQITSPENIWVVSNEKYEKHIRTQLPELRPSQILLEPEKRNTAPCIAYAAYKINKKNPNNVLIVTPSDHLVFNEKEFIHAIRMAGKEAKSDDKIITIGIKPTQPEDNIRPDNL